MPVCLTLADAMHATGKLVEHARRHLDALLSPALNANLPCLTEKQGDVEADDEAPQGEAPGLVSAHESVSTQEEAPGYTATWPLVVERAMAEATLQPVETNAYCTAATIARSPCAPRRYPAAVPPLSRRADEATALRSE